MEQRPLGRSGLWVGRLGLGTMTWGRGTDEYEARDQLSVFLDAGGSLIDTADVYGEGGAETLLGELIEEFGIRDEIVLATKAVSRPGPERRFDASRRHLLATLEQSLRRLRTDVIDVWQLHAWDPQTPIDETLAAMDDAVQSGKVRYAGISNYSGWQAARVATWQRAVPGRAPIVTAQNTRSETKLKNSWFAATTAAMFSTRGLLKTRSTQCPLRPPKAAASGITTEMNTSTSRRSLCSRTSATKTLTS